MSEPTQFSDVNALIASVSGELQAVLGEIMVGLYLYGSLTTSEFDPGISDVDLMAALSRELTADEFATLDAMHERITSAMPDFEHRLEIHYISVAALRRHDPTYEQAVISPGEPFHRTRTDSDWVVNRWAIRERGIVIGGPAATDLIDAIPPSELLGAVRANVPEWRAWCAETAAGWSRPYQSYAIITMCRILGALDTGRILSKREAVAWAAESLSQPWPSLVGRAWEWRAAWRQHVDDPAATLAETLRFLDYALDRASNADSPSTVVANGYDALDGRYRAWAAQSVAGDPRHAWLDRLTATLRPGDRVLDLGCGPGVPTAQRLAEQFDVTGVDISARQIEFARAAVPSATFIIADMTDVELPPASFDAIVSNYALIHIAHADLPRLVGRIHDWLAPDGLFLGTFGTTEDEGVQPDWLGVPMFFAGHEPAVNRALLVDSGFEIIADEIAVTVEPEEGEVAFHWILARRGP
jgi:SAM-dependent methyltransferase